ncbi:MAG: EVE domain-containing protein [Acidihalobacter sp.]
MQYWLMKSEPDVFGIDDLERVGREPWDGIRNYQARNFMRDRMQLGDKAFLYHSNADPIGIAGIMRIASAPHPDPTAFDPEAKYYDPKSDPDNPRWQLVDVEFERKLKRVITLAELREHPELEGMALLRKGNRLSIMPVEPEHWEFILGLE